MAMTLFPSPEPDLYPVFCGPPTLYPAEVPRPAEPTEQFPARDWHGLRKVLSKPEIEALKATGAIKVTGPPEVPARPPAGPGEIAGYQKKQAIGLGRHAGGLGWTVTAFYWRGPDSVEGCGVWLARDALRAVATWKRPAGKQGAPTGWTTDTAYAWRADRPGSLTKMTHKQLEGIIT